LAVPQVYSVTESAYFLDRADINPESSPPEHAIATSLPSQALRIDPSIALPSSSYLVNFIFPLVKTQEPGPASSWTDPKNGPERAISDARILVEVDRSGKYF